MQRINYFVAFKSLFCQVDAHFLKHTIKCRAVGRSENPGDGVVGPTFKKTKLKDSALVRFLRMGPN